MGRLIDEDDVINLFNGCVAEEFPKVSEVIISNLHRLPTADPCANCRFTFFEREEDADI